MTLEKVEKKFFRVACDKCRFSTTTCLDTGQALESFKYHTKKVGHPLGQMVPTVVTQFKRV